MAQIERPVDRGSAHIAASRRDWRQSKWLPVALLLVLALLGHHISSAQPAFEAHGDAAVAGTQLVAGSPVSLQRLGSNLVDAAQGSDKPSRQHSVGCGEVGNALRRLAGVTQLAWQMKVNQFQPLGLIPAQYTYSLQTMPGEPPRDRLALLMTLLI